MGESTPMLQGGGGGFSGTGKVCSVAVSQREHVGPRQYPLEFLQYVGNATRGEPLPPGQSPHHPPTRRDNPPIKTENTAFGYDSDDSSLSSNASGSNKSSDKGDNTNTSEISSSSSVSVAPSSNYVNGYHNNQQQQYNYNTREWRGRNRQHQRPRRIVPERYHAAYPCQVRFAPDDLLNGSKWDTLSQEIWEKFMKSQQTDETFRKKMNLWRYLYITIKNIFPRYGLYVVGSTMSGFGLDTSDMDLCLYVRAGEQIDPRSHALLHLALILHYIRPIDPGAMLIQAKVPILKFADARGLTVDLNCNNIVGIRNTNLLHFYSTLDWRVRPLVVVSKLWAAAHDINDARRRTLSSYSLTLMVIHFLQCGVTPAVLPVVSGRGAGGGPQAAAAAAGGVTAAAAGGAEPRAACRLSLGELFLRFLHYYAHFPFSSMAISVRLGRALPVAECRAARSHKNMPHQWRLISVEEPFDLTNTASSVYESESFLRIVRAFRESASRLAVSHRLYDAWPQR